MTADDVKAALRNRYPAIVSYSPVDHLPGPWTTLEEWDGIDFLAIAANACPPPAPAGTRHAWIGHEVKISRSDYRAELLNPWKRAPAVALCEQFYMAVPDGLLRPNELAFVEPETFADVTAFSRDRCRAGCHRQRGERVYHVTVDAHGPVDRWAHGSTIRVRRVCPACGGRGYAERSLAEREAPTLWVPADVGLLVVSAGGRARIAKRAPVREVDRRLSPERLANLIRWASVRPDPRHAVARARRAPVPA